MKQQKKKKKNEHIIARPLNNLYVGIVFRQAHFMHFVLKPKESLGIRTKER